MGTFGQPNPHMVQAQHNHLGKSREDMPNRRDISVFFHPSAQRHSILHRGKIPLRISEFMI